MSAHSTRLWPFIQYSHHSSITVLLLLRPPSTVFNITSQAFFTHFPFFSIPLCTVCFPRLIYNTGYFCSNEVRSTILSIFSSSIFQLSTDCFFAGMLPFPKSLVVAIHCFFFGTFYWLSVLLFLLPLTLTHPQCVGFQILLDSFRGIVRLSLRRLGRTLLHTLGWHCCSREAFTRSLGHCATRRPILSAIVLTSFQKSTMSSALPATPDLNPFYFSSILQITYSVSILVNFVPFWGIC